MNYTYTNSTSGGSKPRLPQAGGLYEVNNAAGTKASQKISMKIVNGMTDRTRKDIQKWRQALQVAENPKEPKRAALHNLYKDVVLDLHLSSQMAVRKLAVLSQKFMLLTEATGKEDREKTKLLERPWFYKFLSKSLNGIFYGTTLIELGDILEGELQSVHVIDQRHVIPERSMILKEYTDAEGFIYDTPAYQPWLIEVGDKEDLGLLSKIAPMVIWKKNAQQAWAEYIEKFGLPFRFAKTSSRDQKEIDKIEYMLEQMGSAAYGVFPQGTEIDFKDGGSSGTGSASDVFDKMIERCNSEISKAINGTSTISDQKASGFKPELQADVKYEITEADMMFLSNLINFQLLPKLKQHGYPLEGVVFQFDRTESLGKEEQWKIVNEALAHYDIDEKWISETFGLKITGKRQQALPPPGGDPANFNNALPGNIRGRKGQVILPLGCCGRPVNITPVMAAEFESWRNLWHSLAPDLFKGLGGVEIPFAVYNKYASLLMNGFKGGFGERMVGIEYDSPDHLRMAMFEANIHRFAAASSWKDVVQFNQYASEAKNYGEFFEKVSAHTDKKLGYLMTEWNTAQATGQNAAAYLRQIAEKDLYDLQYQTVGDSNVREAHARWNGFTAPADHPVWDWLYPPNDYNDRCEAIQVAKKEGREVDLSKVSKEDAGKRFRFNPGKTNQVFESAHSYFKEFDEKRLNTKKWGMPSYEGFDFSSYSAMQSEVSSYEQFRIWWDGQKGDKANPSVKNYLGMEFQLQPKLLKKFAKEGYTDRFRIAESVADILQKPDEVWINQNSNKIKYRAIYYKRYNDGLYTVITGTENEKSLDVITWYKVDDLSNSSLNKKRNGILIKKAD